VPHFSENMKSPGVSKHGVEVAGEIYSLGVSLLQLGRRREAAFQFRKALDMTPVFPDASLALGHCLHVLGKYEEALSVYDQVLTTSPLFFAAWNNRGTTLLEMCCYSEAAASYSRALDLAPTLHDARVAMATCYQALGRNDEALSACEEVLSVALEHAEAHWNRSLLLLLKGDYREGWREYEWRWRKRNFTSPLRDFPQPLWLGENAAGKTILIHAEQGFGDTLQFCRYVPLVAARGMKVVFECHPPLAELMKSLTGDIEVIPMGRPLPGCDLHIPLMSLPRIFATTVETVPRSIPYLAPTGDRLPYWDSPKTEGWRIKAGLCWAGKAYPDPRRSCPVDQLAPLAEMDGVSWYSLQPAWREALPLPMTDLTGNIRDFGDTAALISRLDLVITVDTAVAHLAGALGKPTWVILPHAPDWRWMLKRQDSPWYPTMRLFRQTSPGHWQDVIKRVALSLVKYTKI
jgi:Flp pilus assembly protein TadD